MPTSSKTPAVPPELRAAYDWTEAGGELQELQELTGEALAEYCKDSEENALDHFDSTVSAYDLQRLHDWLVLHNTVTN